MNTVVYLTIIVAVSVVVGIALATYTKPVFSTLCFSNSDCEWETTNCCPEIAGAKWECVNKRSYSPPACPGIVLCPQVISPKPQSSCICKQGNCVVG